MTIALRFSLLLSVAGLTALMGCSPDDAASTSPNSTDAVSNSEEDASATTDAAFVLGDLIPEFNPPTKEDLDKVEWMDKPVVDVYELMANRKEGEVAMMTAAEALAVRKDARRQPQHRLRNGNAGYRWRDRLFCRMESTYIRRYSQHESADDQFISRI